MGKSIKKEQIMMEDLKRNLLQGKYKEAEDICKSMDDNSIRDMIMTIAYDTENICVYCFIQYMIQRTGKVSWIELAIDIMLNPLCFIEGAYSVALFCIFRKNRALAPHERSAVPLGTDHCPVG